MISVHANDVTATYEGGVWECDDPTLLLRLQAAAVLARTPGDTTYEPDFELAVATEAAKHIAGLTIDPDRGPEDPDLDERVY